MRPSSTSIDVNVFILKERNEINSFDFTNESSFDVIDQIEYPLYFLANVLISPFLLARAIAIVVP
jgi:hypothetical protein